MSCQDGVDGECSSLLRVSELLIEKLEGDRRFVRLAIGLDPPRAVEQARCWLNSAHHAYGSCEIDEEHATVALLDGPPFDGLVEALVDAMRRPLPLGEDVAVAAFTVLDEEMQDDARVSCFLEHLFSTLDRPASSSTKATEEKAGPATTSTQEEPSADQCALLGDDVTLEPLVPKTSEAAPGHEWDHDSPATAVGTSSPDEQINTQSLDQLVLEPDVVYEVQRTWEAFCLAATSREAAGEAFFAALFEGAPGLQALFSTPRVVMAGRFVNSLQGFVVALQEPARLRAHAEVLGFSHLHLDVTLPRIVVFRNTFIELLQLELGEDFSQTARQGWTELLNYMGGALIFVKSHYSARLHILMKSWALVSDSRAGDRARRPQVQQGGQASNDSLQSSNNRSENTLELPAKEGGKGHRPKEWLQRMRAQVQHGSISSSSERKSSAEQAATNEGSGANGTPRNKRTVPTTYNEMFEVNAVVMGFSKSMVWFREVLRSFDAIVTNAANAIRLQEECAVLALRISKITDGEVKLNEYKSCMLAALGSLLPKTWDAAHEVAWSWLWDNMERLLVQNLGKPPYWEKQLSIFMSDLEDEKKKEVCQKIYARFFELAPQGQDFFKQSTTRLLYIAGRILDMTLELYREPWKMVEAISAVGLRHVGYGISTELFGPFLTAHFDVIASMTEDAGVVEAYQSSLGLIAKILIRTINEGSTIVMKAINANSTRKLRSALAFAPRCSRVESLLNIQVGTCQISPLEWAIESGNLEAANAAIEDLLTIRADRDRYYYGAEELFERHPDFVQRLCDEAPTLLPTLLEGLVWRSRQTQNGVRRVNYFVKYLIINKDGSLSDALRALAASKDQAIISHPVVVLVSDTLWTGVIRRQFVISKLGFILSVLVFMLSQAILPKAGAEQNRNVRIAVLVGRILTYVFGLGRLVTSHVKRCWQGYRSGRVIRVLRVPIPRYLRDPYMALSFLLMFLLLAMSVNEPMFYCIGSGSAWPTENCSRAKEDIELRYTVLSMIAMVVHWMLLVDMAAFSTKMQAFLLVCRHIMSELGRFMAAMLFLLSMFSSAISCLRHGKREFNTILSSANCLFAITVGLYEGDYREMTHEPWLLLPVLVFMTVSTILLINLLIAQLNCSYEYIYQDMVGFARLARAQLIVETLASCPPDRWKRFVATLNLDQPIEFDEGDVGLAGGIQVKELGSLHPVVADSIQRFGGLCAPDMPWPEVSEDEDRIERVERLVQAAYKQAGKLNEVVEGGSVEGGSKLSRDSDGSGDSTSQNSDF